MELFSKYLDFNLNYLSALQFVVKRLNGPVETSKSRVGDVYDLGPCYFEFSADELPVTILSKRNFNPFFAIAEAAWIIDGSNKLTPLKYFINSYDKFSDNGDTLNGAYGYRARKYFGTDQVDEIVSLLKSEPETRRAVLTLYAANDLSSNSSNDIPCNTSVFFKIRDSKLDMMVINRSNDLFLGIPYNVFVFNVLLRYIAKKTGCEVGMQRHMSDSLHLYAKDFDTVKNIVSENSIEDISDRLDSFSPLGDDFVNEIVNSRKAILDLDFSQITDNFLKKIFQLYTQHKNGELVKVGKVNNIIEYAAQQWFQKYNK
jgi:thymidylate synthase